VTFIWSTAHIPNTLCPYGELNYSNEGSEYGEQNDYFQEKRGHQEGELQQDETMYLHEGYDDDPALDWQEEFEQDRVNYHSYDY
jgi:hypothetical protein